MPDNPIILDVLGEDNLELEFGETEGIDFDTQPYSKGNPGESAYQIAVNNGFVGSQAEWLNSLKGADGTDGTDGSGISSVVLTSTVDLVDTYTITYDDGHTSTFNITNGRDGTNGTNGSGISSIVKTSTVGLVDTYTILFDDGRTTTYSITNGRDGTNGINGTDGAGISSIAKTSTSGLVDTYTVTLEDGNTSTFTVTNGEQGPQGIQGIQGETGPRGVAGNDGFSPTATVSKSGDTATISITDKNGTTTATVKDGADGSTDWSGITNKPTFATVATSGSYADLSNKPTIPTVPTNVSAFTNDAGYLTSHQDISGKIDEPASEGTNGQVLTTDGAGGRTWTTFTETDPVFSASAAAEISSSDITAWNGKQNALTFDNTPTSGSDNPVKSGGVYSAIEGVSNRIRPACSAFMDEITAVKTYPENNGRILAVNKNHITVTRTAAGTTYALYSLIGSGTSYQTSNISTTKVKALYDAGEFLPRDHYLYNLPDANKKWYLNVSFFRPAGSGEGATIYLTAYDTVNETYRNLASMSISSSFVPNEAAGSYLADFSTLTENEVIMVLFYRRSGTTSYRGVAMEWDWSLESARGIFGDQDRQDSNLAWAEGTTTASRAYAVGDYVTIQGVLCKITAAVANGGTLAEGTNYSAVTGGLASEFVTALGDVETLLASI